MIRPPRGDCLHQPERRLRAEEGAGEVRVHDRPPLLDRRGLRSAPRARPAGVVKSRSSRSSNPRTAPAPDAGSADVGRATTVALYFVRAVSPRAPPAAARRARRESGLEQERLDAPADAGACAGDEGDALHPIRVPRDHAAVLPAAGELLARGGRLRSPARGRRRAGRPAARRAR